MKFDCFTAEEAEMAYQLILAVACNSTDSMEVDRFSKLCAAMLELKPRDSMTKWLNLVERIKTSNSHLEVVALAKQWISDLPEDPAAMAMLAVLLHTTGDPEYKIWYSKLKKTTSDPLYIGLLNNIPPPISNSAVLAVKPNLRKLAFK
jgi:hypothetical protein